MAIMYTFFMCHDSLALTLSSSMNTLQTQTYGAN